MHRGKIQQVIYRDQSLQYLYENKKKHETKSPSTWEDMRSWPFVQEMKDNVNMTEGEGLDRLLGWNRSHSN